MNISFFGSSLLSAYWNGAATYYRGIIRALNARGHRVTFHEPDAYQRQEHRDLEPPDWAEVIVYDNSESAALQQIERSRSADLIVKASGVGVFDELLEAAVLGCKSERTNVVFWDVDAPATLERVFASDADAFRPLIPRYDAILTYGGGPPVVDAYSELGAAMCVPIYNALDPGTHFPAEPAARFRCDLAFLGNRLPDREARVDAFFLHAARSLPNHGFILGGSGWDDKPLPDNVHYAGHVFTADHNAWNSSATAVLNINRSSMARFGFSPPTRIFEAAGAAACIVTDAWAGIEEFFEPGEQILVVSDGDELVTTLDRLRPERARAIGQAAYGRALAEHTYAQRAEQFEQLLEGALTP